MIRKEVLYSTFWRSECSYPNEGPEKVSYVHLLGCLVIANAVSSRWPAEKDLERHTQRDWLVAIREQFNSGLLTEDETIERVSNIGGFLK